MGTNNFSYRYDPIGNRTMATYNGSLVEYGANSLNQYSQITNNQQPITPSYDVDGNMTAYNGWVYSWDAENRMTGVSSASVQAVYSYDYISRRFRKIVNGVTNNFIYDGWNVVREISTAGVTNNYVWGLDMSGTLQGAGGIGGLLSVTRNGVTYYPCYDANGNITDYVDNNGVVGAHREYDPYGNTVVASGALVHELHFWFSTKYLDEETGLYYYGYRFYSPEIGRWASRDPIEEWGGVDLYAFVDNEPTLGVDHLGLMGVPDCCCCCVENLKFHGSTKWSSYPLYGHEFTVDWAVKYIKNTVHTDCTVEWWEKTNRPVPDKGGGKPPPPDEWENRFDPKNPTMFGKWNARKKQCPGGDSGDFYDRPAASVKASARKLFIAVRIKSGKDCPCQNKELTVYITQILEPSAVGGVKTQVLLNTVPDTELPIPD